MATYTITTSNYDDPSFWSSISVSSSGHTLDFTQLPSWFVISVEPANSIIWIWDGSTWLSITEAGMGGSANFGSPTELHYFDEILVGDAQADLLGSDGADTLITGDGADTIQGGLGDDSISAGGGNDIISAGSGDDTVFGGSGDDLVDGGAGNDVIHGGDGNDLLAGGADNDTIFGGRDDDVLFGDDGNDLLSGDEGNDFILGGAGADTLFGGDGDDYLDGGADADLIVGGAGADSLFGGDGNDTIYGDEVPGSPVTVLNGDFSEGSANWIVGGDGSTFVYSGFMAFNAWDSATGGTVEQTVTTQAGANYELAFDAFETGFGVGDHELVVEVLDANGLVLTTQSYVLTDGSSQSITVGFTSTTDDVTIRFSNPSSTETISTDLAIDNITITAIEPIGEGNDTIYGGDGDDVIFGGGGDDSIIGGAGDDLITTGAGADTVSLQDGGGHDTITDFDMTLVGGKTTDQLDVSNLTNASDDPVTWLDVVVTDTNGDGTGDAILTFPGGESVILQGVTPDQVDSKQEMAQLGIPCFAAGSPILTPSGWRAVESIRTGDLVETPDGPAPVIWAGSRRLGPADLAADPGQRPIHFAVGAIGNSLPLRLSPQHAVQIVMSDGSPVLVRAKHLAEAGMSGVRIARGVKSVTYHHLLLQRHSTLSAAGASVETMYPGHMALASFPIAARLAIAAAIICSHRVGVAGVIDLADLSQIYGPRCFPLLGRREALRACQTSGAFQPFATKPQLPSHSGPSQDRPKSERKIENGPSTFGNGRQLGVSGM